MNDDEEIETIDSAELEKELESLGISRYFIQQKDVKDLYTAKRIVEGYNFGRKLTQQEKRVLIQAILDNGILNKGTTSHLSALMNNLQQLGLEEQEIYGTIINLGVNGAVLEEKGYGYTFLLENRNKVCQKMGKYKHRIEKSVSPMTILTALSNNMNEQEEQELQEELEGLGISKQFIKQKYVGNLYMAKRTIECYDFGRELTREEKRALIQAVLNNSILDHNVEHHYLSKLMQLLQKIGLKEQEIYGTIINLGVNRAVLDRPGYGYTFLLRNQNNACQTIANHRDEIRTIVAEQTIQKALTNAKMLMKRAVKGQKDKGTISGQAAVRAKIGSLVIGEISTIKYNEQRSNI